KCSEDPHGMTYIAIGKAVFRHPSNEIYDNSPTHPAADNKEILNIAPHPSEPSGCPGNPVQKLNAYFLMSFPGLLGDEKQFLVSKLFADPESSDKYEYSFNNERQYDKLCQYPDHAIDDTVQGLTGCTVVHKNTPTESTTVYEATDY